MRWLLLVMLFFTLPARADTVTLQLHDAAAAAMLNEALRSEAFWSNASVSRYKDKQYDEIRLREVDSGFISMVTGEGRRDFDHDVVADTVFHNQWKLPTYMDGAKAAVRLGQGVDGVNGLPYTDTFFFLDFGIFYGTLIQRMYRIESGDRTLLAFERLDESFVDAATWSGYQKQVEQTADGVDRRWPPFNSVVPVAEVFGLFIVEPGSKHRTRVTLVNKLGFAATGGASWIAGLGSEMPPVIRSGLKGGFNGCVAIARRAQRKRDEEAK